MSAVASMQQRNLIIHVSLVHNDILPMISDTNQSHVCSSSWSPPQSKNIATGKTSRSAGFAEKVVATLKHTKHRTRYLIPTNIRWLGPQFRPFWRLQIVGTLCIALSRLFALIEPWIIMGIIDRGLMAKREFLLLAGTAAFAIAYCGRIAFAYFGFLATSTTGQKMTFRLRMQLIHVLQRQSARRYESVAWNNLMQRLEQDAVQIGEFGAEVGPVLVRAFLTMMIAVIAMFLLDARLIFCILPLAPVLFLVHKRFGPSLEVTAKRARRNASDFSLRLQEQFIGLQQLQLLNKTQKHGRILARSAARSAKSIVAQRKQEARWSVTWMGVILCGNILFLGYGGHRVMAGDLSVGGLVAYYVYALCLFEPLVAVDNLREKFRRLDLGIRRMRAVARREPSQARRIISISPNPNSAVPFAFQNVVQCQGDGRPVLNQISFAAAEGEKLALVGKHGCGKTAIAYLLASLYSPEKGYVLLEGRDTRTLNRQQVLSLVSLVPQYPVVFSGTLRTNLLDGNADATENQMLEVLTATGLQPLLQNLERGLDEPLGLLGLSLTDEERKRIALARALLRRSPILVLDEIVDALDSRQVSAQLLHAMENVPENRVIFVLSSRPASVAWADRILVLDQGKIIAQGTHAGLMRDCEFYRNLYWETFVEEVGESKKSVAGSSSDEPTLRSGCQ
jgi:ATP-binding cassette, subfamily B, multidrug efflux pump